MMCIHSQVLSDLVLLLYILLSLEHAGGSHLAIWMTMGVQGHVEEFQKQNLSFSPFTI